MSNENDQETSPVAESGTDNGAPTSTDMNRREAVQLLSVLPIAAVLGLSKVDHAKAWQLVEDARDLVTDGIAFAPKFFTPAEFRTVGILADMIIPRDERSGSATDAGVPEFIDFQMTDRPDMQVPIRGGLRWLDSECHSRFGTTFRESTGTQRTEVLDAMAYPKKVAPELSQGAAFFTRFRDLVATGFWTSKMGIADLEYIGNVPTVWNGCPDECLTHLGVKA